MGIWITFVYMLYVAMIENDNLFEATRKLNARVFEILSGIFKSEDIRTEKVTVYRPKGNPPASFTFEPLEVIIYDFNPLVSKSNKRIRDSAEFNELENVIETDEALSKHLRGNVFVGDVTGMKTISSWDFISDIILRQLKESMGPTSDEETFLSSYKEWEELFYTDTVQLRIIAPLSQFYVENECFSLQDEIQIRRMTDEEYDMFFQGCPVHIPKFEKLGLRHVV